jgi:hypothetical protein
MAIMAILPMTASIGDEWRATNSNCDLDELETECTIEQLGLVSRTALLIG